MNNTTAIQNPRGTAVPLQLLTEEDSKPVYYLLLVSSRAISWVFPIVGLLYLAKASLILDNFSILKILTIGVIFFLIHIGQSVNQIHHYMKSSKSDAKEMQINLFAGLQL